MAAVDSAAAAKAEAKRLDGFVVQEDAGTCKLCHANFQGGEVQLTYAACGCTFHEGCCRTHATVKGIDIENLACPVCDSEVVRAGDGATTPTEPLGEVCEDGLGADESAAASAASSEATASAAAPTGENGKAAAPAAASTGENGGAAAHAAASAGKNGEAAAPAAASTGEGGETATPAAAPGGENGRTRAPAGARKREAAGTGGNVARKRGKKAATNKATAKAAAKATSKTTGKTTGAAGKAAGNKATGKATAKAAGKPTGQRATAKTTTEAAGKAEGRSAAEKKAAATAALQKASLAKGKLNEKLLANAREQLAKARQAQTEAAAWGSKALEVASQKVTCSSCGSLCSPANCRLVGKVKFGEGRTWRCNGCATCITGLHRDRQYNLVGKRSAKCVAPLAR